MYLLSKLNSNYDDKFKKFPQRQKQNVENG